jgi:aspartate ammonia-lyase
MNMNANEVIANRASELLCGKKSYNVIHPNDHVNLSQSTNDVIPSAIKIAIYRELESLLPEIKNLYEKLNEKQAAFSKIQKIGRTCLQDALPVTLGQEFGGYSTLIKRQAEKIKQTQNGCLILPLGGTAIGTGLCAFAGYGEAVFGHLNEMLNAGFTQATDLFDGLQNADDFISVSSSLKSLACAISKIAKDLRLLSSGPRAGFSEITLPAIQPGSSMMPGKVNPILPELMIQICYQICGNDLAVTMAAESGELDLNVWEPVFIKNLFESIRLLRYGIPLFTEKCVQGIEANEKKCRESAENSLALSTIIASVYDYETGAMVAQKAYDENKTIKEVTIELGLLTKEQADEILNTLQLTDNKKSNELLLKLWREKH